MSGRACKVCSLPMDLAIQANALLDQGTPLREISRLLSLAGRPVSFMGVARHRKHYTPGLSVEQRTRSLMLQHLEEQLQELKMMVAKRYGRRF